MTSTVDLSTSASQQLSELSGTAQCSESAVPGCPQAQRGEVVQFCLFTLSRLSRHPVFSRKLGICSSILRTNLQF